MSLSLNYDHTVTAYGGMLHASLTSAVDGDVDKIRAPVALSWHEVSAAPAVWEGGWAPQLVWSTSPTCDGG
jgi:hypothetical protein